MRIYVNDAKDVFGEQYCVRGMREFAAKHGLDFRDFVRNGIAAEDLLATGDGMALKIVRAAEERRLNGRQ